MSAMATKRMCGCGSQITDKRTAWASHYETTKHKAWEEQEKVLKQKKALEAIETAKEESDFSEFSVTELHHMLLVASIRIQEQNIALQERNRSIERMVNVNRDDYRELYGLVDRIHRVERTNEELLAHQQVLVKENEQLREQLSKTLDSSLHS